MHAEYAAIMTIRPTLDQAALLKALDHARDRCGLHTESRRKGSLAQARLNPDREQQQVLSGVDAKGSKQSGQARPMGACSGVQSVTDAG